MLDPALQDPPKPQRGRLSPGNTGCMHYASFPRQSLPLLPASLTLQHGVVEGLSTFRECDSQPVVDGLELLAAGFTDAAPRSQALLITRLREGPGRAGTWTEKHKATAATTHGMA